MYYIMLIGHWATMSEVCPVWRRDFLGTEIRRVFAFVLALIEIIYHIVNGE